MKRMLLAALIAIALPQAASAQPTNKLNLPKMTLEEFVQKAEKQPGIHSSQYVAQTPSNEEKTQKTIQVQKLFELIQDKDGNKLGPVRGGTKEKPLGCYLGSKTTNVEFTSGYKDVEPRTQCEWAYDLSKYIVENGGGWDNYRKYLQEKNPIDAIDRAHVPYDKQTAFADTWWKKNSLAFRKTPVPPKHWWLQAAILDGNNLWTRWEQLNDKGSADYASWRDAELATIMQKK